MFTREARSCPGPTACCSPCSSATTFIGRSSTPSSSAEGNPCRACPSSSPWRFAPSMATCRAARCSRAPATPTAGSMTPASSQNSTVFASGLQLTPLHPIVSHDPRLVSWISNEFVEGQAGAVLWLAGLLINLHSDHILRNLRKPGETGYKIPRGGMFEFVSGANFFGEMVEWLGFAIACCTLQAWAFSVFSITVIGPRSVHHHKWYLEKFEDYPKKRKAVIPFLY
ncbi:3-oxo-5-alpha-steroid 4-dehydrogenase 1 isoform X4 [Petromyzon marinus]|uniref:3-oxo-5-alpha-steroid 4-dehydrogenase 1 isoform X3 n=1 Tax=Petromyzon marinus TaxID=7757 RepID=A0AAJ7WZR8_PETMA|nr:3-oxo-5-alpha-steroid 4-dehydrogenase 1 isoform X3 [Petromyzon marinus]